MKVKVGVVQDAPVFFDKDKTIDKLEALVSKYAADGCQLLVFPESFIPGYPRGFSFGATIGSRSDEGRALYNKYHQESIDLGSQDKQRLEEIAKNAGVYLCIGATEKKSENGSLYCSVLYISPTHGLLGVHRKIKPTGTERLIWAESDGSDLVTVDTEVGMLGGLICWENYMPLARVSMYDKGVEIYIAPTADARVQWSATMTHIALEGRCFVLSANQYITQSMYPQEYRSLLVNQPDVMCRGGSMIVSPLGEVIAGPLFDQCGVLTAEIDLDDVVKSKLDFDNNGHYTRPDIFKLEVKGQPEIIKEKTE